MTLEFGRQINLLCPKMMLNRNFAYACEIIQNFNLYEFGQGFDLSQKF